MIYEVNLSIALEIYEEFMDWLQVHVDEMLTIDGFESAQIMHIEEPEPPPGRISLSVRYSLRDRAALNTYLSEHAARMRADGLKRFGEQFSASRRILRTI